MAPETTLILVRHGESASNAGAWISSIATCGGLTDLGRAQAEALRARFVAERGPAPDVVLSSTMRRARETAEIVAAAWDADVEAWPELGEREPGECEGLSYEDYTTRYGRTPYADWEEPMSPGGESHGEFQARIAAVHDRVLDELAGRRVVAVCHGGIIVGTAIALIQGSPAVPGQRLPWVNPRNSSISEWRHGEAPAPLAAWRLARYNDHAHLAALGAADGGG
jgi:probable phosphoglycerate mutase